jgi:hypothetical protein
MVQKVEAGVASFSLPRLERLARRLGKRVVVRFEDEADGEARISYFGGA